MDLYSIISEIRQKNFLLLYCASKMNSFMLSLYRKFHEEVKLAGAGVGNEI